MNTLEKTYSVCAVIFAVGFIATLLLIPESRQLKLLLPLSLTGVTVNIGLMFVVLHDILKRHFTAPNAKYIWIVIILLFWPAVLYYLPKYGFRKR